MLAQATDINLVRVLLVTKNVLRREMAVKAWSSEKGFQVTCASTMEEALNVLRKHEIDVVMCGMSSWTQLRDAGLPGSAGGFRKVPRIVLTSGKSTEDVSLSLVAGVDAYVPRSVHFNELVNVVRCVSLGFKVFPGHTLGSKGGIPYDIWLRFLKTYGGLLTKRELDVVGLIGQGKAEREISQMLSISIRTVQGAIGRSIAKLGVNSRLQIAVLVWSGES